MPFGTIPCFAWWFVAGLFGGWLLWWLFDRLFLRNGRGAEKLAALESERESAHAKAAQYAKQIEAQRHEIDGERAGVKEREAKYAKLIEQQRADLAASHAQLGDVTKRHDQLISREAEFKAQYANLLAERDNMKAQLSNSAGEINRLNSENLNDDSELAALRSQLETARAQIGTLSSDGTKFADQMRQLQHKLAVTEQSSADWQKQVPALHNEISRLKGELEKALAQGATANALKSDAEATRRTLASQAGEIEQLRKELAARGDVAAEITRLKNELAAKAQSEQAATTQIAELKSIIASHRGSGDDLARLNVELKTARSENERINKELHVAQEWLTRTGTDLEGSRAAHQGAVDEISRLKGQVEALNVQVTQYDKLRSALEAARKAADLGLNIGKS